MRTHTLIIGGTGMLKAVSVALASSTTILSSVASTKSSLTSLNAALTTFSGTHHTLQLNWNDREHFLESLAAHIKEVGPPSLVVAWLHDDDLGLHVARLCGSKNNHCDFFQVRGSSAGDPKRHATQFAQPFEKIPGLTLRQVILGFIRTPSGSRWLRNDEISAGVLQALESQDPLSIVGTVEPWDERP